MTLSPRALFFAFLGLLFIWLIYAERAILTPFVAAGIFAYLFNPIVNIFEHKLKMPRALAIFLIYGTITVIFVIGGIMLSSRVLTESSELRSFIVSTLTNAQHQTKTLPEWVRPTAVDFLANLKRSRALNVLSGESFFFLFPQAISRIISFIIFLVSTFYFLKEGGTFFKKLISLAPHKYKDELEILFKKTNGVLGGYLRGQIFLVFLMSIVTYISLLILGIRFSFLLGLFSGFAEIVPVVGPIVAGSVAVLVALLTGTAHFGLQPIQAAFIVIVIYFVLRQLEDYFVIPYVMGKVTQLPSFVIFFAVIAGGHIAGILGLILAVPIAAVGRIVLEFSLRTINKKAQGSE